MLREQAEHMDAPDRCSSMPKTSCTAGAVHTWLPTAASYTPTSVRGPSTPSRHTATLEAARANVAAAIVITKPSSQRQNRIVDWLLEGNAHGKIVLRGTSQDRDETMHTDQRILQLDPELYLGMDLARLVLSAVDLPKNEIEKISCTLTSDAADHA